MVCAFSTEKGLMVKVYALSTTSADSISNKLGKFNFGIFSPCVLPSTHFSLFAFILIKVSSRKEKYVENNNNKPNFFLFKEK